MGPARSGPLQSEDGAETPAVQGEDLDPLPLPIQDVDPRPAVRRAEVEREGAGLIDALVRAVAAVRRKVVERPSKG